ncbi:hypothetical protein [Streptomyces sp. NPDC002853]
MTEPMTAIKSDVVDLEGVSLEVLLSLDGDMLAEPMARLLRQIDAPRYYFADYNPSATGASAEAVV